MSHVPDNLDAQLQAIDRLLSGVLPEHEAQAERRRLLADPGTAALLLQQERVQASLSRSFTPPPVPPVVPSSPTSPGPIGGGGGIGAGLLLKWLAVILMSLSTIVGAYYLLRPPANQERLDIASAYREWTNNPGNTTAGTPNANDLQVMLASKLGRQIDLPNSAGIKYLGVLSLPQDTPLGVGIKAEVSGVQVLIAIDLAPQSEPDTAVQSRVLDAGKGIHQHTLTQSGLRLYEVSKSTQPLAIPGFVVEKVNQK
jgi:hypothetical protein